MGLPTTSWWWRTDRVSLQRSANWCNEPPMKSIVACKFSIKPREVRARKKKKNSSTRRHNRQGRRTTHTLADATDAIRKQRASEHICGCTAASSELHRSSGAASRMCESESEWVWLINLRKLITRHFGGKSAAAELLLKQKTWSQNLIS